MPAAAPEVSRVDGDGESAFTVPGLFRWGVRRGFPQADVASLLLPNDLAGATLHNDPSGGPMATTVTPTHAESFSRIAEAHQISPSVIDDLLEHIPVGVMIADASGEVVFANAAARALRIDRLEPLQWAITRALL